MAITISQLPYSDRKRTQLADGGTLESRPVFLSCPECRDEYSATRGDYFALAPATVLRCPDCQVDLEMVRTETHLVEVDPADPFRGMA